MNSLSEFLQSNIETANLNELLPRQMRQDTPTFVTLLEEYYRFLNQKDNPSYVIQRIIDEHDLDKVVDDLYLEKIKLEIARSIPTSPYVQKAFLLKRIIDSYGIRGNDESVLYFFRIFFNEDVTIYNPWEQVLIPSQGKWIQTLNARVILYCGNENTLENNEIVQYDKQGRRISYAQVKTVKRKIFNDKIYFDLTLRRDTVSGIINETIPFETIDGKTRGVFLRSLSKIKIVDGGSGYSVGDRIYLGNGLENVTFNALVTKVGPLGQISTVSLQNEGIPSSIEYLKNVENNPLLIPNLSEVYLNGILSFENNRYVLTTGAEQNDKFFINSRPGIDLDFYIDKNVSINGIIDSIGVNVDNISETFDKLVLYDFKFYDNTLDLPAFDRLTDLKEFDNIVIRTLKSYDPNTEAKFQLGFKSTYLTDGYYDDEKGRPSGFSVLQDSFYYQVFSYEINSPLSLKTWKSQFDELIHPAGFKVFNRINSTEITSFGSDLKINNVNIAFDYIPLELESDESIQVSSFVDALGQNYNYDPYEGPYFLLDYTSTLSFVQDLVMTDPDDGNTIYNLVMTDPNNNATLYDLIFSKGSATELGLFTQGENSTNEWSDPYEYVNLDPYGFEFEGDPYGYYRRSESTVWYSFPIDNP